MKRIIIFLIINFILSSFSFGQEIKIEKKSFTVFQTINNSSKWSSCLVKNVWTSKFSEIIYINENFFPYLEDKKMFFYDDMYVEGNFVLIGTETYKCRGGYERTVPVYMFSDNFKAFYGNLEKEELIKLLKIFVDFCVFE